MTTYQYTSFKQFGGTGGQPSGGPKNKGILLTNVTASANTVDLFMYSSTGVTTGNVRVILGASSSDIMDLRVWGVSCGAGITGAILS